MGKTELWLSRFCSSCSSFFNSSSCWLLLHERGLVAAADDLLFQRPGLVLQDGGAVRGLQLLHDLRIVVDQQEHIELEGGLAVLQLVEILEAEGEGEGKMVFFEAGKILVVEAHRHLLRGGRDRVAAGAHEQHLEVADGRHGVEKLLAQGLEYQRRVAVAPLVHAVIEIAAYFEVARLELGQGAVGVEDGERQVVGIGEERLVAALRFLEKSQVQETRLAVPETLHLELDARVVGQAQVIAAAVLKAADLVDHQVVENGRVVLVDDDVDDQVEKDRDQHDGRDDEEQRGDDQAVADLPEQAAADDAQQAEKGQDAGQPEECLEGARLEKEIGDGSGRGRQDDRQVEFMKLAQHGWIIYRLGAILQELSGQDLADGLR